MDSSDPDLILDEYGVCNWCRSFDSIATRHMIRDSTKLQTLISEIKLDGQGKTYDCVQGISGGTDSSYTAWTAHKLGLRVLLLHWDNGYDDPRATENIKRIVDQTGFDIRYESVDFDEFRDLQLAYLKSGVIDIEVPTDHAITALTYGTAAKLKVKYLLSGSNMATEAIQPKAWGYRKFDLRNLKDIHRKFGGRKLAKFPTMGTIGLLWHLYIHRIRQVSILNYLNYNRETAKQKLRQECGWQDYGLKHFESIYTRFYQAYILPTRFGVDKRRSHLSSLINSGQITREEALAQLERPPLDSTQLERDRQYILAKLGLSEDQFEELMRLPIRRHSDFKTDEYVYSVLHKGRHLIRGLMSAL